VVESAVIKRSASEVWGKELPSPCDLAMRIGVRFL
jgi:hypothetical protein